MRSHLPWTIPPGNVPRKPLNPQPKWIMKAGVKTCQPRDRHVILRVKVPFGVHGSEAVVV
eukprot:7297825-Heterocapsa_arctica.AAC.1